MAIDREEAVATARARLAAVQGIADRLEQDAQRRAAATAEQREKIAKAARSGELGPDWAKLQGRIDLGQTSIEKVFEGTDESGEAVRLRETSRRRLETITDEYRVRIEDGVEDDPADEVAAASTRLTERLAALRARLEESR
jgi:hypothetical protein